MRTLCKTGGGGKSRKDTHSEFLCPNTNIIITWTDTGQLYVYSPNLQDIPEFLSPILLSTQLNNI